VNTRWEQHFVLSKHGVHTPVDVEIVTDKEHEYIYSIDYLWGMIDDDLGYCELATLKEVATHLGLEVTA
jgi:hypothetical protein